MKIEDEKNLADLSSYMRGITDRPQQQIAQVKGMEQIQADRVEISDKSKELKKIQEIVNSVPDIREARVNELKNAVENKTYNVKGEAIADSLIKKALVDVIL